MKKLVVYSAMLLTLLAVTACETEKTTTNNPNQPTRDRTGNPQNPNPNQTPPEQPQR